METHQLQTNQTSSQKSTTAASISTLASTLQIHVSPKNLTSFNIKQQN